MAITINLNKDKYKTFVNILHMLKDICSDICIVDGKIFQFDDKKATLYDIDLTELVGQNTIYLNNIGKRYDLFDVFKRQDRPVDIIIEDKRYLFKEKESVIELQKPDPGNLFNKPVKNNSDNAIATMNINKKEKMFEYKFEQSMIERLKSMYKTLETDNINLSVNNGSGAFSLILGGDNKSVVVKLVELESIEHDENGVIAYPIYPFLISALYINSEAYPNMSNPNNITLVMTSEIGLEPIVPIKMYSTHRLIKKT